MSSYTSSSGKPNLLSLYGFTEEALYQALGLYILQIIGAENMLGVNGREGKIIEAAKMGFLWMISDEMVNVVQDGYTNSPLGQMNYAYMLNDWYFNSLIWGVLETDGIAQKIGSFLNTGTGYFPSSTQSSINQAIVKVVAKIGQDYVNSYAPSGSALSYLTNITQWFGY